MRWAMSSTHAALVVDLAWHTIATTWQPSAPMAAAVQVTGAMTLAGRAPPLQLQCHSCSWQQWRSYPTT
jgi:hypothetical protein